MADQTPPLITEQQFNSQVKGWTISTRGRMASNAPVGSGNNPKKLRQSVSHQLKFEFGAVSRVRFDFERHGIFVHYGVGRGYVKQGSSVVRTAKSQGIHRRRANDWFDVEIISGLTQLADYTQEFYGDLAMKKILDNIDRLTIQKAK